MQVDTRSGAELKHPVEPVRDRTLAPIAQVSHVPTFPLLNHPPRREGRGEGLNESHESPGSTRARARAKLAVAAGRQVVKRESGRRHLRFLKPRRCFPLASNAPGWGTSDYRVN